MTERGGKFSGWLACHGAALAFLLLAGLFLFLRLRLFDRYGLSQDEILILSQIKTWSPAKIWHFYGFSGQGFFLQHFIFYVLSLGGRIGGIGYFRTICLLESLAGLGLLWLFVRRHCGLAAAVFAALAYALCPFQILYTLYIRFYALVMTLLLAEIFFYFKALGEKGPAAVKHLAIAAIFAVLAYCTHQFSIFLQPALLLHFIIFCFCQRPWRENRAWLFAGLSALLLAAMSVPLSPCILAKTGLVWNPAEPWLAPHWGRAAARLVAVFWMGALHVKICTVAFLWLSLGLMVSARLMRREKCWLEVFLGLAVILPYFFLSHLSFGHFFANRYLAFWFPVWTIVWSGWLVFPAAILGNLRILEKREAVWKLGLVTFVIACVALLFPFRSLDKIRYVETGNLEAVKYLEAKASEKGLPLIYIAEPDKASYNCVLSQYYFDILGHEGLYCPDLLAVMRKGAAYAACPSSMVAYVSATASLPKLKDFECTRQGRYSLAIKGPYTNWHDISRDALRVHPKTAGYCPPLPQRALGVLDIGTRIAGCHLLEGFSEDEFISQEENFAWCEGTNMLVRFHPCPTNAYSIGLRARAIVPLTATFSLGGRLAGQARFGTDFTNLLFHVDGVPMPEKDQPLLLRIATDKSHVPGRISSAVYDSRNLSLCFDKLALWPASKDEELSAALVLETPRGRLRAGQEWNVRVNCANMALETWKCEGETPVRLAVLWRNQEGETVQDDRIWMKRDAASGDSLHIEGTIKAPPQKGKYQVTMGLVKENVRFFEDVLAFPITVVE